MDFEKHPFIEILEVQNHWDLTRFWPENFRSLYKKFTCKKSENDQRSKMADMVVNAISSKLFNDGIINPSTVKSVSK